MNTNYKKSFRDCMASNIKLTRNRLLKTCCMMLVFITCSSLQTFSEVTYEDELRGGYGKYVRLLEDIRQTDITQVLGLQSLGLEWYEAKFLYKTKDELGNDIELSAYMVWPSQKKCNVVLYCPYTHTSNEECATRTFFMSDFFADGIIDASIKSMEKLTHLFSNWVIIPDGEGFGENARTRTQIYLNHEVWARHMTDCLMAAWELRNEIDINQNIRIQLKNNFKMVVAGTSQGGGTALATMRYMENVPSEKITDWNLDDLFHLSFANVCCGPYDPVATMKSYFKNGASYPCVIPMVIQSMINSYPDIMCHPDGTRISESEFYTKDYIDNLMDDVNDYLGVEEILDVEEKQQKIKKTIINTKNLDEVNSLFQQYFRMMEDAPIPLPLILNDETMKVFDDPDHSNYAAKQLLQCLEKNNIFTGDWGVDEGPWLPEHYIKYHYNVSDNVVPYDNSEELARYVRGSDNSSSIDITSGKSGLIYNILFYGGAVGLPVPLKNAHVSACAAWMLSSWTDEGFVDYDSSLKAILTNKIPSYIRSIDDIRFDLAIKHTATYDGYDNRVFAVLNQDGEERVRFASNQFQLMLNMTTDISIVGIDHDKLKTGKVNVFFLDSKEDAYLYTMKNELITTSFDYYNVDLTGSASTDAPMYSKPDENTNEIAEDVIVHLKVKNNANVDWSGPITATFSQGGKMKTVPANASVSSGQEETVDFSVSASEFDYESVKVSFTYGEKHNPLFRSVTEFEEVTHSFIICQSKKCGDDLTWSMDLSNNMLTISGTDAMYEYNSAEDVPWYQFHERIRSISIEAGVTAISDHAFEDCNQVGNITCYAIVPPTIGTNTFNNMLDNQSCRLNTPLGSNYLGWRVPLSWWLTSIESCGNGLTWAFNRKSHTLHIEHLAGMRYSQINDYDNATSPWAAYANYISTIKIDGGVSYIGKNAFDGFSNLQSLVLPGALLTIGENAFANCTALSSVDLGFCDYIGPNAFANCSSLNSIAIDRTDVEVSHAMSAFAGVATEGTLYVPDNLKDTYRNWIGDGKVLPKGWNLDSEYCMVDFFVFDHGTASIDITEPRVPKGTWVTITAEPDEGYAVDITVDDENMTSHLVGNRVFVDHNLRIWVHFKNLNEVNDEPGGIKRKPSIQDDNPEEDIDDPDDVSDDEEAFDVDNGSYAMDVFMSCFVAYLSEQEDTKIAAGLIGGAIGASVGGVAGFVGGYKVGEAVVKISDWVIKIRNLVDILITECQDFSPNLAPQIRRRNIENGSTMTILKDSKQEDASYIPAFHDKATIAEKETLAFADLLTEYFGSEKWIDLASVEELTKMIEAVQTLKDDVISVETLLPYKPNSITLDELETFAERINHSRSRAAGLRVASNNYIHASLMNQCSKKIAEAEAASQAFGYDDTDEMWQTELPRFYNRLSEASKSVCATITLQFTQKLVMTRQAFRGTLTVFNGHEDSPMRDVRLNLVVSDKQGHVATSHEFQINGQSLKGFAGEVDLGSGWTLDAQATGEATILFIPTKYAAPTEPIEYSFGGTLTYIDPFTDLEVTRDLYPVTLTVKPSPNLDLTYFMQRDILGDNALTTDVVEPMVPAEFALLIHNDGYGDATDVRMTTEQPKIVENEKGLLIDFELLSSQVNGKDKVMALGGSVPADFGTIPAHSTAYAQWMLQASLLGHFTDYNVEATHVTSYGNEDLSLLNEVTIHELIHSLSLTDVDGEPLVGWLVNDVTDANDEPDMLYFSNAETTSVNMLSEEQMNMGAVDNDNVSVTLSVGVAQAGWYYGCLVDPMAGRARIAAVTRQSDGASIDPQNFWLTEYTLVDGKDPIQEYMLHFADTLSTTSETYTIAFEMLPEEMLSVTAFTLPDKGDSSIYPDYVTTVGITFSKAIDPATFTIDDLKLTCRGKTIDLNGVTLSTEDNTTFTMNLTGLTTEDGYYVLTVQTADITDATGYNGQAGKSVDWTQFYGGLLVLRAESQPAEGGSVSYEETAQKAALRRANENGDAQNESVLEVKVPYNSDGALTAQSAEGFGFGGWYMNDQLLSTESRYTSIFIDHTNLTAQFKQLYFDLTVDWNANRGTVTGAGTGKYSYGSNLSLVATPFEGYRFYQWEVNDEVPDDNPGSAYTHTVTGDATLSPLFLAETSSGLLLGDVKEDGNINVGDYTALVSLIVGTDGGRYLLETADHNGNKKADVGDLATEVNMIMDIGSFAANSLRHMGDNGVVQSEFDPDNRLYGPEMTVKAGDEISVPLFLANKDEVSAFQTDIVLPDGLTLLDVAVAEERTTKLDHNLLVTSSKNGGTIRLLAGSSSNVSYRGAAGAVVMLRLRADEDMEDGEYIYQLKHTVLSSADSQIFHAPDCSMPMRIGNATGILTVSPQAESAKGIYDVAGRKIANEATIDVVNRLPAGVYVVSGRKIVVR